VIARCSKRSCLVAAGAEPGTGNLSPRVDDCKPLSMLFASSDRSLSPGTLPSWVLPLLRSPGEPWSGPFQMIVGRRCGCPRRRQRSLVCSSEPWLGMSGPGLRSVSCGNGPPSVAFVVLCTSSASRACAGAGVMVAKLVALVRRCRSARGAGARSARLSVQFMWPPAVWPPAGFAPALTALEGNPVRDNYLVKHAAPVWGPYAGSMPGEPPGRPHSGHAGAPAARADR